MKTQTDANLETVIKLQGSHFVLSLSNERKNTKNTKNYKKKERENMQMNLNC